MRGQKKTPKVPGFMRVVVAANVARLLDHHYSHIASKTGRQLALAKDTKLGLGTIQRVMGREVGASLDNLEAIANALQISLYQLMLPSLDAKNPQLVKGATKEEERLYRLWRQSRGQEEVTP